MQRVRLFFLLFFLLNVLQAGSVLTIKKGWQLVGVSIPLESMSMFEQDAVEEVWHFDATSQSWKGFSPKQTITDKMADKDIETLERLENWHGFWIKSSRDWVLTIKDTNVPDVNSSTRDLIALKKGWNLISLPVDTVVSPHIFKAYTVLKFNNNEKWEFFDVNETETDIERLDHIKNSDGFWLKADDDANISIAETSSQLRTFKSDEEMRSYIKEMTTIRNLPICGIEPFGVERSLANEGEFANDTVETTESVASDDSAEEVLNTSGTNLQEDAVDEADILKHNGKYIFYLDESREKVLITTFEAVANNQKEPLYSIEPNFGGISSTPIDSMYLTKDRVVLIDRSSTYYVPYEGYDTSIKIHIYDVSDITQIKRLNVHKIDGYQVTSRMIGDRLFLVSNFYPSVKIRYAKVQIDTLPTECSDTYYGSTGTSVNVSDLQQNEIPIASSLVYDSYICYGIYQDQNGSYYRYDYYNPIFEDYDLIPDIINEHNETQSLVKHDRLYAPLKLDQKYTITSLSSFDIQSGNYEKSTAYVGNSSNQYASVNALYLISNDYPHFVDFRNSKHRSIIYKFNLDENLTYSAKGSVYGRVLNQFSLSEDDEVLRVATTEGFSWVGDTNNLLYTLGQQNATLFTKGVLSGLGKEGETIKSVRFMGDKAFVVTFRETDPLYTIDLSDPTKPMVLGELEVNGYSDYLHPIDEDRLLGIGRDADSEGRVLGLKIELFDISDLSNPYSLDSIILDTNTYSELEHNHKALSYRVSDHLFAIPYSHYGYQNAQSYLGVYQVVGDKLKIYEPLTSSNQGYHKNNHRGLFFDFNQTTYIGSFSNGSIEVNNIDTNSTKE